MALLDIPSELLIKITYFIDPLDISNFAQSSRRIYDCSISRLGQQRYAKSIRFNDTEIPKYLDTLCRFPRTAFYTRRLEIHGGDKLRVFPKNLNLDPFLSFLYQNHLSPSLDDLKLPFPQLLTVVLIRLLPQVDFLFFNAKIYSDNSVRMWINDYVQGSPVSSSLQQIWKAPIPLLQPPSHLTTLKFRKDWIHPNCLSAILHSVVALRTFAWYTVRGSCHGVWGVLREFTRTSLETFIFQCSEKYSIIPFADFQNLTLISLSAKVDPVPLCQILPRSIKEVHITRTYLLGSSEADTCFKVFLKDLDPMDFSQLHSLVIDVPHCMLYDDHDMVWEGHPILGSNDAVGTLEPWKHLKAALIAVGITGTSEHAWREDGSLVLGGLELYNTSDRLLYIGAREVEDPELGS